MLFKRKDLICILRLNKLANFIFVFGVLLFCGFFINSKDVNAWQTTDPYFDDSQTFNVYRSYMTQADGAPDIVNGDYIPNFSINYNIINQTDSALQTKTLFGFLVAGYEFNGDDKTKTYHSAQAVFYFISPYSSYFNFGTAKVRAKYVLTDDNGGNLDQWVNCSITHTQDTIAPYIITHSFECPQVTMRRKGYYYKWVDLYVGETSDNDFNSSYYYKFRDGGGLKIANMVGQYIVSSSDNASELALEQITVQNQTIINQNQQMIDDSKEYYDKTYDALDNISNQSPSDIQGTENQKTTDLIGALGSLVGAFTSIQPADNCEIQLDFPSYAGGSQIVNPCQHKEKAPQIVLIGSSVFLVLFALKYWNKMAIKIYKVIRSFIDGTDDTEGED